MNVLKKILNVIIDILIVVVLIVSIFVAVTAITSKATGISAIFGTTVQTIQSDSMNAKSPDGYPGGGYEAGDLILGKATDGDPDAMYGLGDIVTFRQKDTDGEMMLICHRIVDVVQDSNGNYKYQTWGDNREMATVPDQTSVDKYIYAVDILALNHSAEFDSKVIKGVGNAMNYIKSQQGFFLIVLLPMIAFFLYAVIRVVISAMNYKKEKVAEEKQEAVDAAVAAALAEKNGEEGNQPEAPADMTPEQMEQFKQFLAFQEAQKSQQDAPPADSDEQTAPDEA